LEAHFLGCAPVFTCSSEHSSTAGQRRSPCCKRNGCSRDGCTRKRSGDPSACKIVDTTAGHQVALGAGGDRVVSLTSVHSLARDTLAASDVGSEVTRASAHVDNPGVARGDGLLELSLLVPVTVVVVDTTTGHDVATRKVDTLGTRATLASGAGGALKSTVVLGAVHTVAVDRARTEASVAVETVATIRVELLDGGTGIPSPKALVHTTAGEGHAVDTASADNTSVGGRLALDLALESGLVRTIARASVGDGRRQTGLAELAEPGSVAASLGGVGKHTEHVLGLLPGLGIASVVLVGRAPSLGVLLLDTAAAAEHEVEVKLASLIASLLGSAESTSGTLLLHLALLVDGLGTDVRAIRKNTSQEPSRRPPKV